MIIKESWGTLEWLVSGELRNSDELTLGRMIMVPGGVNDLHCHDNCEEMIYVVRGRVEHEIDTEKIIAESGAPTVVPRGSSHRTTNIGGQEAELLIVFSSANRTFKKIE